MADRKEEETRTGRRKMEDGRGVMVGRKEKMVLGSERR